MPTMRFKAAAAAACRCLSSSPPRPPSIPVPYPTLQPPATMSGLGNPIGTPAPTTEKDHLERPCTLVETQTELTSSLRALRRQKNDVGGDDGGTGDAIRRGDNINNDSHRRSDSKRSYRSAEKQQKRSLSDRDDLYPTHSKSNNNKKRRTATDGVTDRTEQSNDAGRGDNGPQRPRISADSTSSIVCIGKTAGRFHRGRDDADVGPSFGGGPGYGRDEDRSSSSRSGGDRPGHESRLHDNHSHDTDGRCGRNFPGKDMMEWTVSVAYSYFSVSACLHVLFMTVHICSPKLPFPPHCCCDLHFFCSKPR